MAAMKSSVTFISILCIIGLCLGYSHDEELLARESRLNFKLWQLENKKFYQSLAEEGLRYQVYLENLRLIEKLNVEHKGDAFFKANKFADMSPREFEKTVLMPLKPAPQHSQDKFMKPLLTDSPLPDKFDWRDKNMVTSVKDQGSAGTCWAFSTVANVEGQFAMHHQKLMNLSVEQVVDCDDSEDPPKDYGDCGVYGGWPYLAFEYLHRQGGLESWDDYTYCCGIDKDACFVCPVGVWNSTLCGPPMPYCNMSQSCPAKLDRSKFVAGLNITDWKAISTNETEIAHQLMQVGPLSVALDARMLQFYHGGVFNPFVCSKTSLDHAVLLVGFGTDSSIFGSKPYWTIKNSWGPKWGENGYFRIKRGAGTCGVNTQVTTAILA